MTEHIRERLPRGENVDTKGHATAQKYSCLLVDRLGFCGRNQAGLRATVAGTKPCVSPTSLVCGVEGKQTYRTYNTKQNTLP